MKFYKHILVPFLSVLLCFIGYCIYSYTLKKYHFFTQEAIIVAIGAFTFSIPLSYLTEYQKKKNKNKFNR